MCKILLAKEKFSLFPLIFFKNMDLFQVCQNIFYVDTFKFTYFYISKEKKIKNLLLQIVKTIYFSYK